MVIISALVVLVVMLLVVKIYFSKMSQKASDNLCEDNVSQIQANGLMHLRFTAISKVLSVILAILSVIGGVILACISSRNITLAIITCISGIVLSVFLYGIGCIVEGIDMMINKKD